MRATLTFSTSIPAQHCFPIVACLAAILHSGRCGGDEELKPWHELRSCRVQPHDDAVRALAFSPDGMRLASGSSDHTICVLRTSAEFQQSFEVHVRIPGHVHPVTYVQFDSAGKRVLSAGQDMHARLWDVASGNRRWEIPAEGPVALHPDGRMMAAGEWPETAAPQGKIRLVQVADGVVLHTLPGHKHFVTGVVFSSNGKRLVSSGGDGFVRSWSTADGELLQSAHGAGKSFTFSSDATLLASGGPGPTGVYLWQFPELKLLNKWHTDPIVDLAFISDSRVLAVCTTTDVSPSLTLQLFRVSDGTSLQTLIHEKVQAMSIALHPKGKLLAAGMSDGSIRFFAPAVPE